LRAARRFGIGLRGWRLTELSLLVFGLVALLAILRTPSVRPPPERPLPGYLDPPMIVVPGLHLLLS
jgi:hypothetical protein